MKTILMICSLLFAMSVFAEDATQANLQGKWKIVKMGNSEVTDTNDVWEFKGNQWIVWSEGKALSPDPFKVENNVIDLDYTKIKVLEKTKDTMKIDTSGTIYILKKIN